MAETVFMITIIISHHPRSQYQIAFLAIISDNIYMSQNRCQLILALDAKSRKDAFTILDKTCPQIQWVKVGLQLFTLYGPDIVKEIADKGYKIFLDLKLHDIPNQVASSIRSLKNLPLELLTIHVSGGTEMIQWSLEAANEFAKPPTLLGVTVLTSIDTEGLNSIGVPGILQDQVVRLAKTGAQAGLKGFVCSPLELPLLRNELGNDIALVTPGIRPAGSDTNEQKRIMTPAQAAQQGATYIVVGRPIYKSYNPKNAIKTILKEINSTSKNHG